MAYQGGYGGQQSAYGGPVPQQQQAPQQYGGPQQQQYNDYNDGYGYEDCNGGSGRGGQYQDQGYAQGPPQQDQYGSRRGGQPMFGGRGGPIQRPPTADGHRGGPYPPRGGMGPGPGRGMRPGPLPESAGDRGHRTDSPISPRQAGFGGQQEQQMVDQMSGMDLIGQRPRMHPGARLSSESQRSQRSFEQGPMNGGRGPPQRGYPPQGYPDQRAQGPDAGCGQSGGFDDGYGGQMPPRNEFGPPSRSMTMPVNDARQMPPPRRMGTMSPNRPTGPTGQGVPPRPATATSHRPPPQRTYPSDPRAQPQAYGGEFDESREYGQPNKASFEDVYDSYYENPRHSDPGHEMNQPQTRTSFPDFDAIPQQSSRGSFEHTMRPSYETAQPGARQTAKISHAKSQPDLRQPQAAIFEMAGDVPAVPPVPVIQPYHPGAENESFTHGGYDQMPPRGPSAPPGPTHGLPSNPAAMRVGGSLHSRSADGISPHPAPIRPGLMANSMVSLHEKPPPVRNYNGIPHSASAPPNQPQSQPQRPMQAQPMQQRQAPAPAKSAGISPDSLPVTAPELEHLRQVIKKSPGDQETALRLAKRLVEACDTLVPRLPDPKSRARARERYLSDAHKILKKLASAQNSNAMFFAADSAGRGLFTSEPDFKEAFTLYQSAAKLGHAAAAYRTAVCCEIGHEEGGGTRKDPMKAIQWYKRAATLGDPPAMYKVGMILLKGLLGQPKNPREAVGWLKRAAERADAENPHALHELGLLYESAQPNDVIIRDEQYAFELFRQAAELGYKFSEYRLGCIYEYGLMGCPIDPRLSIMWYSRAATHEEHQSELALSGWYLTGSEGVLQQSYTEAYLWARKAAIAGLAKAEYAMGYFTEVGIGVAANLEDAKRWYWRAAAQDFPKARDRLEDLKRSGKNGTRQRERISRTQPQEGECVVM